MNSCVRGDLANNVQCMMGISLQLLSGSIMHFTSGPTVYSLSDISGVYVAWIYS